MEQEDLWLGSPSSRSKVQESGEGVVGRGSRQAASRLSSCSRPSSCSSRKAATSLTSLLSPSPSVPQLLASSWILASPAAAPRRSWSSATPSWTGGGSGA